MRMHNFLKLFKGEMVRLVKYNILQVSFAVTVLWLLVIFLIGKEQAPVFVPLFIFMDAAVMTIMLIGAGLFYEKQENTIKTLMITPSGYAAILSSKLLAAVYLALQSTVIISVFAYFLFDVAVRFVALYGFIIIITLAHASIGYVFAARAKDFNGLIAMVGMYMVLFAFPSIFFALGALPETFDYLLFISPTHASLRLVNYGFAESVPLWQLGLGFLYLVVLTVVLMVFMVAPKYAETAIRE
ncbi:MAG: hypothetical protein EA374_02775 [Acholeplasmatales bacterium]|nr:MAG: hypothetical protein EA374_02775 [Acholeplasmatales bacterium]